MTSYGSMSAFFLMGAALIAVGIFISSLTENQGFAAGIGIAVILLNYFSISLAEYVSATAFGSAAVLFLLAGLAGFIINYLTKNDTLAYIIGLGLMAVITVAYLVDQSKFEGLLPDIMRKLSLFDRLDIFVNGVFDMTAVTYFVSVIIFFLFLSVQSLEKRRYN